MAQFLIAYHGGRKPKTPEAGANARARFDAWLEGLGDAVVNPGTPLGMSTWLNSDGVIEREAESLTGFSIVNADDLDAALEIAKACPFLEMGTLEVAQVMTRGG